MTGALGHLVRSLPLTGTVAASEYRKGRGGASPRPGHVKVAFERLEPYARKSARTVLRGAEGPYRPIRAPAYPVAEQPESAEVDRGP